MGTGLKTLIIVSWSIVAYGALLLVGVLHFLYGISLAILVLVVVVPLVVLYLITQGRNKQ